MCTHSCFTSYHYVPTLALKGTVDITDVAAASAIASLGNQQHVDPTKEEEDDSPKKKGKAPQPCSVDGCSKNALRWGVCHTHGGSRYCKVDGCEKYAQRGGVCCSHGANLKTRTCKAEGCNNWPQQGGVCKRHGAKKKHARCAEEGCTSFVVKGGLCGKHGKAAGVGGSATKARTSAGKPRKVVKQGGVDDSNDFPLPDVPALPALETGVEGGVAKKDVKAARKACSHEDCTHVGQTGGLCYKHAATTTEGTTTTQEEGTTAEEATAQLSDQELDAFLLESSDWNTRYLQLKTHFEQNGTSHLKKVIPEADVANLTKEEAADLRALSRWTLRQRKLKRSGDMEHYKVLLMERLKFEWTPRAGHGPDKWNKQYELLKKFKVDNGHVEVPFEHGKNKLALWMKTQLTLYRNGLDGKLPKLRPDRVQMLEELGVSWGVRKRGLGWEDRYSSLLEYKERFGHANVPWQWSENVALAQWVNSQRKKYKIIEDGKESKLTPQQIKKLNDLGFKWSTYGKGRYTANDAEEKSASKVARKSEEVQGETQEQPAKKARTGESEASMPMPPLPEMASTDEKVDESNDNKEDEARQSTRQGNMFAEWRPKNKGNGEETIEDDDYDGPEITL